MIGSFFAKAFWTFVIIAALFFLNYYGSRQWLRNSALEFSQNFLAASTSALGRAKAYLTSQFTIAEIITKNQILSRDNRRLFALELKIEDLQKENDFLRKELGIAEKKNWHFDMARIFQLRRDGLFHTALIDKGSDDGLQLGWPVVVEGDVLFGVIKEIMPSNAVVYLVSDPRLELSVKTRESSILGRTRGALNEGMLMELVAKNETVYSGETALTSGLDGLPVSLVVGEIYEAGADQNQLFRNIKIRPAFQEQFWENVFIVKP